MLSITKAQCIWKVITTTQNISRYKSVCHCHLTSTDEERGSRGKKHQKKEQIVVPSPPQIQLEISSDDEIEKKEQSEG